MISEKFNISFIAKRQKPLCFYENNLITYKDAKFYLFDLNTHIFRFICNFNIPLKYKLLGKIRIFERLLRIEPRSAILISEGKIIFSFKGFAYVLDVARKTINKIIEFRNGMSTPLYFTRIDNIDGFENKICYGEYFSNPNKDEVSIYSFDEKTHNTKKLYTFKKGEINHIHNIVPDKYRNRVWILTGDFGDAASIWYTDNDFKTVIKYLYGEQNYRSCALFPLKSGILYATDSQIEENNINFVSIDDQVEKIMGLNGSVIYSSRFEDKFILSTTVESNSYDNSGKLSLVSYKRGNGIKDWYSHLILGDLESGFETIAKFKKDFLPMGLFQFGTITFPSGVNKTGKIIFYGNSLYRIDGKLIILDKT